MLGPGVSKSKCESPIKAISPCDTAFVGLVCRSPTGYQRWMLLGFVSQMQVLKAGVPGVRVKPFAPQGEASGSGFPADYGSSCEV